MIDILENRFRLFVGIPQVRNETFPLFHSILNMKMFEKYFSIKHTYIGLVLVYIRKDHER